MLSLNLRTGNDAPSDPAYEAIKGRCERKRNKRGLAAPYEKPIHASEPHTGTTI